MILLDILIQALVFLPLALGIFLSYNILKIPDLTVEGSFVLGASIFAVATRGGYSIPFATIMALGGGGLAGMVVSLIQYQNRISPLIAGILMVFILTSLNLVIMGRPNLALGGNTIFTDMNDLSKSMVLMFFGLLLIALLGYLLKSRLGLVMRAFGNNSMLVALYGKNPEAYRIFGLVIGNMLAAFAGVLTAQLNGYADINMGLGLALIAIGTVIIGTQLEDHFLKNRSLLKSLIFCVLGVLSYFTILNLLLMIGVEPIYLKMLVGFFLIVVLWGKAPSILKGGSL